MGRSNILLGDNDRG